MSATTIGNPATKQCSSAEALRSEGGPKTEQPKRGWISTVYRHYKGKKLGPYYVRRWKVGTKLHRQYINARDLERVKAECAAYREHRSGGKEVNRWLTQTTANLAYVMRMCKWEDQGKVRPQDCAFMDRLRSEGFDIDGRPPLRRKTTRKPALIDGEVMVVTTVFELDGTTRVFVAPLCVNSYIDSLKRQLDAVRERMFGPEAVPA